MKRTHFSALAAALLVSPCYADSLEQHYQAYEAKVTACIETEKTRPPLSASDLQGLSKHKVAKAIAYLKNKRIVDCSAREELGSLAHMVAEANDANDIIAQGHRYLSTGLVEKERAYMLLSETERAQLEQAVAGKSLEVDLMDLYSARDSKQNET